MIDAQSQSIKLLGFLENAKQKWDEQNPEPKSWWSKNQVYITKVTSFLIFCTDGLVQLAQTFAAAGPDKKIAVLAILAQLFDYLAVKAFPFWLTPFVPLIKQIVIGIVISNLIEFIVAKYKEGAWNMENKNDTNIGATPNN